MVLKGIKNRRYGQIMQIFKPKCLFVVYAIRNEAIKKKCFSDHYFMDLSKCFDAMWNKETMNDMYDLGVQDDRFTRMSKMNEECRVRVKTPVGITEKFVLHNIEMQGTVPASLRWPDGFARQKVQQ